MTTGYITLLSFDLWRNCYIKHVVLCEENSILPLPGRLEASGVESVWAEVSQESQEKLVKVGKTQKVVVITSGIIALFEESSFSPRDS